MLDETIKGTTGRNTPKINKHLNDYNRKVNDLYIDTKSVTLLIENALKKKDSKLWTFDGTTQITVPSIKTSAKIRRSAAQIKDIFEYARSYGQWEKSLIVTVSFTEDFVASIMRTILRAKPIKLMTSIKANEGKININLADIIKGGADKIIEDQVTARVGNAIYASPKEYSTYLSALLEYEIQEELVKEYIEVKARRDIIIHANGVINQMYLDKTGQKDNKDLIGDILKVDKKYFEDSLSVVKRFVNSLVSQFASLYNDDEDVASVLKKIGF